MGQADGQSKRVAGGGRKLDRGGRGREEPGGKQKAISRTDRLSKGNGHRLIQPNDGEKYRKRCLWDIVFP